MKYVVEPEPTVVNGVANATTDPFPLLRYRSELDRYYAEIRRYEQMEPDEVLISISGVSARLMGIRAELVRSPNVQRASRLRTAEVDPLLDHLKEQFHLHSRLQAIRQLDWEMTRGAPS